LTPEIGRKYKQSSKRIIGKTYDDLLGSWGGKGVEGGGPGLRRGRQVSGDVRKQGVEVQTDGPRWGGPGLKTAPGTVAGFLRGGERGPKNARAKLVMADLKC